VAIRQAVQRELDGGRDVVLVLHSYGGWPGICAVVGLDKAARMAAGESTGIVELVFIAAFLLPDDAPVAAYAHLPQCLTVEAQSLPLF
jgi:hypothetical protein